VISQYDENNVIEFRIILIVAFGTNFRTVKHNRECFISGLREIIK